MASDGQAQATPAQHPGGEATTLDAPLLDTLRDIEGKRCVPPTVGTRPSTHQLDLPQHPCTLSTPTQLAVRAQGVGMRHGLRTEPPTSIRRHATHQRSGTGRGAGMRGRERVRCLCELVTMQCNGVCVFVCQQAMADLKVDGVLRCFGHSYFSFHHFVHERGQ